MQPVALSGPKRTVTTSAYHDISARNIKQSAGWLWQEKATLRVLAATYTGKSLMAARSVYLALTEIASNQFTPDRAHTSCAYLGQLAGLGENAVRHYLHEFAALGLVAVEHGVHAANTYVLLAPAHDQLADGDCQLADGAGQSRGITRDTPSDSEDTPSPTAGDTPLRRRGIAGSTQPIRIPNQKEKDKDKQTRGVGVGNMGADEETDQLASLPACQQEQPAALTFDEERAIHDLNALGVRHTVVLATVQRYGAAAVLAWLVYVAANTDSVKSPAGFILAKLRSGEMPPTPPTGRAECGLDPDKYLKKGGKYYQTFGARSESQA